MRALAAKNMRYSLNLLKGVIGDYIGAAVFLVPVGCCEFHRSAGSFNSFKGSKYPKNWDVDVVSKYQNLNGFWYLELNILVLGPSRKSSWLPLPTKVSRCFAGTA